MKTEKDYRPPTTDHRRKCACFMSLLSVVCCLLSLSGCIRVSGNAGYSKIQDDEIVAKSTGFDVDSSRLIDNRGVS